MMKFLLPFSVSTLCLMMTACGGGSNNIDEDPTVKPIESTAVGCTSAGSSNCFEFTMEYPVAGLQYSCGKDKINVFSTKLNGNVITGGCDTDDTATFYLNATNDYRVEFGSVKMSDLGVLSADTVPVHLTLLDMAKGITGKAAQSLSQDDETVQAAMQLVKIFQAIGNQKNEDATTANVIGNIQLLELDEITLTGLADITGSVTDEDLIAQNYANKLKPWIDVSQVSDDQAFAVLKDAAYMSLSSVYQADITPYATAIEGLIGYAGTTGNDRKTLIGTFYLLSDRSGFTQGNGIQWRGTTSSVAAYPVAEAVRLTTKQEPMKMYAAAQTNFIDPVTKRMGTGSRFRMITSDDETMMFNQGRLLNDYAVAGSTAFYKYLSGEDTAPTADLAKWTQSTTEGEYAGGADFLKVYPIAYLDRRVFQSVKSVESGKDYYFPLYATLTFEHTDNALDDIKLGIVIDENGDIRSDIRSNATDTDMSGMCGIADASEAEPEDHYGVKQYRLGTLTATNPQEAQGDRSFGIRMIIAGSQFGKLDGVVLGLSTSMAIDSETPSNLGVRINIHNLLNVSSEEFDETGQLPNISITDSANAIANWVNFYNLYRGVYVKAKDKDDANFEPSAEDLDQQKRIRGTLSIDLADCYEVKKKS